MANQTYEKEKGLLNSGHVGIFGAQTLIACAASSFCEEIPIASGVCAKLAWSRPVHVANSQWEDSGEEEEEERFHATQWKNSDCDCSNDADAHQTRTGWRDGHEETADCENIGAGAEGWTKERGRRARGRRSPTEDESCLDALSRVLWSFPREGGGSFCLQVVSFTN